MKKIFVLSCILLFFIYGAGNARALSHQSFDAGDPSEMGVIGQDFDVSQIKSYDPQSFQEAQDLPNDLKSEVSQDKLVEMVCLMSKWKTGRMMASFVVLRSKLVPLINRLTELDIEPPVLDLSALENEARSKINNVCQAKTFSQAQKSAKELFVFGNRKYRGQISKALNQAVHDMKSLGQSMKSRINQELTPFIKAEVEKIKQNSAGEGEGTAVDQAALQAQINQEMSGMNFTSPDEAMAYVQRRTEELTEALKNQSGLNSGIAEEIKSKTETKIQEMFGDKLGKLTEFAGYFQNLQTTLNQDINREALAYQKYKSEVLALKKEIIMTILDVKVEWAKDNIRQIASGLQQASLLDDSVPKADELISQLEADKDELIKQINEAVNAGDLSAMENALSEFVSKWNKMQAKANLGVDKSSFICSKVSARISKAKPKIQTALKKIDGLLDDCLGKIDDAKCLRLEEMSVQINDNKSEMSEILSKMDQVEQICTTPDNVDIGKLKQVLANLNNLAKEAQIHKKALEDKEIKAVSLGMSRACEQSLAEMVPAYKQMQRGLAVIEEKKQTCQSKNSAECEYLSSATKQISQLRSRVNDFSGQLSLAEAMCRGAKNEKALDRLTVVLENAKVNGRKLKYDFALMQKEQNEASGDVAKICRSVMDKLSVDKQDIFGEFASIQSVSKSCQSQSSFQCQQLKRLTGPFSLLKERIRDFSGIYRNLDQSCQDGDISKRTLHNQVNGLENFLQTIRSLLKQLKTALAAKPSSLDKGVLIEAENESSKLLYPKKAPWHSHKELDLPAGWRPDTLGRGDWYLSRGGEYLEYIFNAPVGGNYYLWSRDFSDNKHSLGSRSVKVFINQENLGVFSENSLRKAYPPGVFAWHLFGQVSLNKGENILKVEKNKNTSAAALLDAFYLTADKDEDLTSLNK